jgi:hypothetical protein
LRQPTRRTRPLGARPFALKLYNSEVATLLTHLRMQ